MPIEQQDFTARDLTSEVAVSSKTADAATAGHWQHIIIFGDGTGSGDDPDKDEADFDVRVTIDGAVVNGGAQTLTKETYGSDTPIRVETPVQYVASGETVEVKAKSGNASDTAVKVKVLPVRLGVDTKLIEGSDATDQINAACDTALADYDAVVPADLPANFSSLGIEADGDLTKVNELHGHTAQTGDVYDALPSNFSSLGIEADGDVHADVKQWLGTAPLALASQRVQSDAAAISGSATAADNVESVFTGQGGVNDDNVELVAAQLKLDANKASEGALHCYNTNGNGYGCYQGGSYGCYQYGGNHGCYQLGGVYGCYQYGGTTDVYLAGSGTIENATGVCLDHNMLADLTDGGRLDQILDAILEDTGTTLDTLLDTLVARLTAARAAKLDLLKAGNVTVTAPVNASDDVSITQRDDYATGNGRALEWSSTGGSWMQGDLGNSSIKLGIRNRHTGADYERAGTITSSTAPQAVQVALPSTFTASLTPGAIYKYQLRAQSTAGLLETLATGDLDADGTILGAAT